MAEIPGVEWIRLHYAYPTHFPMDLLRVMREHDNVCKYLDIALQHISDHMLKRMQRHITKQETLDLIAKIREEVPGITLRTTLMVGFPGETEEDFNELMEFVGAVGFERMGAFRLQRGRRHVCRIELRRQCTRGGEGKPTERPLCFLQESISTEISEAKSGTDVPCDY